MTIILGILKGLGITLLCIVAFVLLLVITVLFAPIHYRLKGAYQTELEAEVKLSWLCHFLSIRAYIRNGEQNVIASVLGIPVWDRKRASSKKMEKEQKKAQKEQKQKRRTETQEKPVKETAVENEAPPEKEITSKQDSYSEGGQKQKEESINYKISYKIENKGKTSKENRRFCDKVKSFLREIKRVFQKIYDMLCNIKYTFERLCDTIKNIKGNITYYKKLLQSKRTKRVWNMIKRWGYHLYRNIKPQKAIFHIEFGMEEPAAMADVLSIYSVLYPIIGSWFFVNPVFEQKNFSGDFYLKGSITLYWFAYAVWKFLFDKDVQYLKKRLIREEF